MIMRGGMRGGCDYEELHCSARLSVELRRLTSLHDHRRPAFDSATAFDGFNGIPYHSYLSRPLHAHIFATDFGLHLLSTVGHYIGLSLLGKEKEKLSFSFRKRPLTLPNTISAF